jgi:hypothetical protein
MDLICPKCGKQNQSASKFCFGCGTKLTNSSVQLEEIKTEDKEAGEVYATSVISPEDCMADEDLSTRPLSLAILVFKECDKEIAIPFRAQVILGRKDKSSKNFPDVDLTDLDKDRITSRRHASFIYLNGQYYLRDLGSMNGTFVNGVRLESNTDNLLKYGDEVMFGQMVCTFKNNN